MATRTDNNLKKIEKIIGYKPTLGSMLRAIRECEGMTQAEFARLLDVPQQKLCDIEKGRKFISAKLAADFAKKLGDSPEFFVMQCLQDELDRNKINVKLAVKCGKTHHQRAYVTIQRHCHGLTSSNPGN